MLRRAPRRFTRAIACPRRRDPLEGPLGAGKTTLVRGLLEALGHAGEVPSPSFAIVQPYEDLPLPLWHVDLYRISHPSELAELGLDSVLDDGVLVVEWPGHAGEGAWPPTAPPSVARAAR
jgi:tRNA threonylcarbamoyladenosine biosynthesis protein TsaE